MESTSNRTPDDTVFYSIFPDESVTNSVSSTYHHHQQQKLHALLVEILSFISPYTSTYIWQHAPFTLSVSTPATCPPHLHGHLRYGDNIEDEWFVVFLLFSISSRLPSLSIRVWDSDGEFLLIESAFHLPGWINPETSANRVFIRRGDVHIVPKSKLVSPSFIDSLRFLIERGDEARASEAVQAAVKGRVSEYPERALRNVHCVRVRVPVSCAKVLKEEPCLISLAIEGFYDRDVDTMKYAARMERFLPSGRDEELVLVAVRMSRAMYAQLLQQKFQAPKVYPPMTSRGDDGVGYLEAELGLKIACGFEMMYQQRKKDGEEGRGSTWQMYKESLEKSGYFDGLLPGSKEYNRLMENAENGFRKSSLFHKTSETLSAPVKRIDEILALPGSMNDFKNQKIPPSDDDSWLYSGEEELNAALQERQKEMDLYNIKHKKKEKTKETQTTGPSSSSDCNPGDVAKAMRAFMEKVSSYKGAEVPENRDSKEVDLDVDQFLKDMEQGVENDASDVHTEQAISSDMDFDESEDGSDIGDDEDAFMDTYSSALSKELRSTSLGKSLVHIGNPKQNAGTSNNIEDMEEDFTPVDVDINLVKCLALRPTCLGSWVYNSHKTMTTTTATKTKESDDHLNQI